MTKTAERKTDEMEYEDDSKRMNTQRQIDRFKIMIQERGKKNRQNAV